MLGLLERLMILQPHRTAKLLKALPSSWQQYQRMQALKRSLRLVASRSKFYRERFFLHKMDISRIQSPADLGELFTTADDLLNTPSDAFLCALPQLAFETAGTSGKNKKLFYRYEEFDMAARRGAVSFYLLGLQKEDRILNAFDFSFWFPGYFMSRLLPLTEMFSITVGKIEPTEVYRRMEDYRFTVILGEPTWMVQLTELAQEQGRIYPLKLIVGSGEMLTERAREWVEKTWSADFLMAYASVDAGTYIGIECYKKQGYHINDAELWVEVVDPDTEGYGEVVFTTLTRTTMPLIRYRTKDVARMIHEPCPCGRPGLRLSKIVGRADELVVFGGGNIHPSFFEDIFKDISEITEDWQVAVRHRGVKEILEIRLELRNNGITTESIADAILKKIEGRYPDMWRNYKKGMYDIAFTYYAKHTLREKRKLRRLIDEREEIISNPGRQ